MDRAPYRSGPMELQVLPLYRSKGDLPCFTKAKTYYLLLKPETESMNINESDNLLGNKPVLLEDFGVPPTSLKKDTIKEVRDTGQDYTLIGQNHVA